MAIGGADPYGALKAYDIGPVSGLVAAGGTAGRTWKVAAPAGAFFLRMRGPRTSSEARLRFDHGLRAHLAERGVPTVPAIPSADGRRWVRRGGRVYELYHFVVGRPFCPDREEEIVAAAQALAGFHLASTDYRPPAAEKEAISQYTTLRFSDATSDRMDDPHLQAVQVQGVRGLAATRPERDAVDRCLQRIADLMETYAGTAYGRLTGWVMHGDYTPANLLFSEDGRVVGIFDLDWAVPGARCRDVADGLYFFATRPRRIDAADIWSLTDAAEFDADRCAAFLKAYCAEAPLSADEVEAIPRAFAGRWLSIRLEGMAKVPPEDRFRFFSRDIETPLLWLDANWEKIRGQMR